MNQNDDNILFCSFHTNDDYYAGHGARLRKTLDELGIQHEITGIDKQPGDEWITLCRKKIKFLFDACMKHPDKKVFWIDVDCTISELPDLVRNFSADIIGFQRGFASPLKIGYAEKTRFWEPCFWGINTTDRARAYIAKAYEADQTMDVHATDDYFFEEAWRALAQEMSFQVISSLMVVDDNMPYQPDAFFSFGSSGNVAENRGKAAQHTSALTNAAGKNVTGAQRVKHRAKMKVRDSLKKVEATLPTPVSSRLRRVSDQTGLTRLVAGTTPSQQPMWKVMQSAYIGERDWAAKLIAHNERNYPLQKAELATTYEAIESFFDYTAADFDQTMRLVWWEKPYPGNFGDWLSPLIFQDATQSRIEFRPPVKPGSDPHLFGIGSIGRFINQHSIVVGTGISQKDLVVSPKATYVSLRGPHTAEVVGNSGAVAPDSFGDPGLLLSRVMPMERGETNGRIAIVRHHSHLNVPLQLADNMDELSVLVSRRSAIEGFVRKLHDYDAVITSAMHVYIVCHSYGIPCALVNFEEARDAVHGDGVKYLDYALGAGVPERRPQLIKADMTALDPDSILNQDRVSEEKLDEIAEAMARAVSIYRDRVS